ncbi:hypothetical protein PG987_000255 [Apiospora arundinis]
MNRQVYIVYEPRSDERIVPMVIQAVAGFSHAKLVVLEQGTMSGPGKVYHIGKERDSSMGQLRRDNIEQWGGLDEGERPLLVCATSLTDDQIIARVKEIKSSRRWAAITLSSQTARASHSI